ncbi:hypothetical protein ACUOFC_65855, partial [Escherichia sp. TWPC-MK]
TIEYNVETLTVTGQINPPTVGLRINGVEDTISIQSRAGAPSITEIELLSGGAIIEIATSSTLELINANGNDNTGDF